LDEISSLTNPAFSFEALRVAGYASCGGADLGEVLVTTRNIPEGDERAWHDHWKSLGERLEEIGDAALRAGHNVTHRWNRAFQEGVDNLVRLAANSR
jgi:hypothetical protein